MTNFISTLTHGINTFAISNSRFHLLNTSQVEVSSFPINSVIVGYSESDNQYYIGLPGSYVFVGSDVESINFYNTFKTQINNQAK